jgi:CBS domain-containing protein/anti-sigma regulatory factor (Ser/Thr protein kinase)
MPEVPISPEAGPEVVLDLVYRLKIRDVMKAPPITARPSDTMRTIQYRLRDNGITGLPIVDGDDRLVGIVAMEDVVSALDSGRIGEPADALMTRQVIVLEDDMPLAFAVTYFNRYNYGRFPVLDRDHRVIGIVSASDIIRSLLVAMNAEVQRLEDRLAERRAAEEPPAEGEQRLSFAVMRLDFEHAGSASAEIKKVLKAHGIDSATVRRAAVAAYELELNQVIHSEGGTISLSVTDGRIEIAAEDVGPGIADVDAAMREGWSTASEWIRSLGFGAGMGLPNAKRVSDEFSLDSGAGRGTRVRVVIYT